MKKKEFVILLALIGVIVYGVFFWFSVKTIQEKPEGLLISDVGRIYPVYVKEIVKETQVEDIRNIVLEAKEKGMKVSIAGRQHSQGGHTYYDNAIVLDMKEFNDILNLDTENNIITVQSGATWEDVQNYINPYNLSVKVMQSSNIFTIGGTLSANAHGRDLERTQVIETVKSFRLLLTNGTIVNVSREENNELFRAVIGGYGIFGVILDVDIELTNNEIYEMKTKNLDYVEFKDYFYERIYDNSIVTLMLVRPSISPNPDSFLTELTIFTWEKTNKTKEGVYELLGEQNVIRDKFFFGLSRKYDWGKELRWYLQKKLEGKTGETNLVSRNNAMRPPTAPIEFLEYYSSTDTDVLQEFYVPTRNFIEFMDEFREILLEEDVNALSSTIRFVKPNNESYLAHTPNEESFAIIVMSNDKLSKKGKEKTERVTQRLVDTAIKYDGTYYLTYGLYPTQEQIREAYPNWDLVVELKRKYDPDEVFMSKFYERYALGASIDEIEKKY